MSDVREDQPARKQLPPGTRKVSIKEAFAEMIKAFQAETGINSANLNALYNAQMTDIIKIMLSSEIQTVQLTKKVVTITKERDLAVKKLLAYQSMKVVKTAAIIKTKPKPKRK